MVAQQATSTLSQASHTRPSSALFTIPPLMQGCLQKLQHRGYCMTVMKGLHSRACCIIVVTA